VTISIALFLFGLFILLIQNTGSAVSDHSSKVSVALFLADQNSSDVLERVKEDISAFLVAHKVTDATRELMQTTHFLHPLRLSSRTPLQPNHSTQSLLLHSERIRG
jgi:hypothetical protein